jgi:hypothetical protein
MIAFRNSGTTRKSDRYTWELSEPTGDQHFYYLEPQNVTTAHGLWGIWGETTKANSVTRGIRPKTTLGDKLLTTGTGVTCEGVQLRSRRYPSQYLRWFVRLHSVGAGTVQTTAYVMC